MKILVISHAYIADINRDKWRVFARLHPGSQLTVVFPSRWKDDLFDYTSSQEPNSESNNCKFVSLDAFNVGNEMLYGYYPRALIKIIKNISPDILHVEQGDNAFSYFQAIIFTKIFSPKSKLSFFTWINWTLHRSWKYKLFWRPIERFNLFFSNGAIAGNRDAGRILQEKGLSGPVKLLPQLGVDMTKFKPARSKGKKTIGFIGRIVQEKGVFDLAKAFSAVAVNKDWTLLFVGSGPELDPLRGSGLKSYVEDLGIQDRVTFQPTLGHKEICDILNGMQILVLPSHDTDSWREQFGHVLIEAMACKVAVVGSDGGEIPNVLSKTGLVFRQKDVLDLTRCLELLMSDDQLRDKLADLGYNKVAEKYSHEAIAKETYSFWKELLNGSLKEEKSVTTIAVIGAGYVGLVSAACFAKKGIEVIIVERDLKKIKSLSEGRSPFFEPGLDELVEEGIKNKKLKFTSSISELFAFSPQAIFLCVGTPSLDGGGVDLSYVEQVAREIGQSISAYTLVVNKSTVPVGSSKKVEEIIKKELEGRKVDVEFEVASNPEFLKEGTAVSDSMYPDRVVVGTRSQKAKEILHGLYKPFLTKDDQFLVMSPESSELSKYAANSMLATRISFMNELSRFADKVGADIEQVRVAMGKDARIGNEFLKSGIGFGGSCFPKDVDALISMGRSLGEPMTLAEQVNKINDEQRERFVESIEKYYEGKLQGKRIGIWGLSFKPNTDDIRCAPSVDIIESLLEKGAQIFAYDPVATENIKEIFGERVTYCSNAQDVLSSSDSLAVLTEWKEFLKFGPKDFFVLKDRVVFDGRNCFDPQDMTYSGIHYHCIGRNVLTGEKNILMVQKDISLPRSS